MACGETRADADAGHGDGDSDHDADAGHGDGDGDGDSDRDADAGHGDGGPVDANLPDAGDAWPALPRLRFERTGALGSPPVGDIVDVTVAPAAGGYDLSARRFLGWDTTCEVGDCRRFETLPARMLERAEAERLLEALDAVPSGECATEPFGACDPAYFSAVFVDDHRLAFGACVVELCQGYTVAVTRLGLLLQQLAARDDAIAEVDGCYSPWNPGPANDFVPNAGCLCDLPDQGICVESAGMICRMVAAPFARWQVVEDGPCTPRVCDDAEAIADMESCLASHILCYERRPGTTYCGL